MRRLFSLSIRDTRRSVQAVEGRATPKLLFFYISWFLAVHAYTVKSKLSLLAWTVGKLIELYWSNDQSQNYNRLITTSFLE